MREYRVLRMISFYYNYLLLLTLITSFFWWFDWDAPSLVRAVLLLAVPGLILNVHFRRHREEKERQEGKIPTGRVELIPLTGLLAIGSMSDGQANEAAGLFYAAAVVLYFVWRYYSGKYILLYRNPSVSRDTRERAGRKLAPLMLRLAIVAAAATVLLAALTGMLLSAEPRQPDIRQEENEESVESRATPPASREEELKEQLRRRQPEPSLFLIVLRYVVYGLLVVMGLVAVGAVLYWIATRFFRRRTDGGEYYEEITEKRGNEEYTSLAPTGRRKRADFPEGNDGKVRRAFYRRVKKKAAGQRVDASHTARELRREYLQAETDAAPLTALYEKARYSAVSVTDEEIDRWEKGEMDA